MILAEKIGLKMPNPNQNWLSLHDIQNLLNLADLEVIKKGNSLLLPFYIPFLSKLLNQYVARLPFFQQLCLVQYVVARVKPVVVKKDFKVSVIIPARNEAGNIEDAVKRTPRLGKWDELFIVTGKQSC